jgi:hypothetical protein
MTAIISIPLSAPAIQLMKEAYELDDLIKIATQEMNRLIERRDLIIEELLSKGIREAGNYEIIQKIKAIRKINVQRFQDCFPVEFEEIKRREIARATANAGKVILLKDAEQLIGTERLDPVCDLQTSSKNTVVKIHLDGTEHPEISGKKPPGRDDPISIRSISVREPGNLPANNGGKK